MIAILMLLSCQVWDDLWAPGIPSATPQIPLVKAFSNDVRRVDDYVVPGEEWFSLEGINDRLMERCLAGEDLRGHLPARLAMVEVRSDAIWVAGEQVTAIKNWQAAETKGHLIKPLYEALEALADARKEAAVNYPCWPNFDGRVLFAIHPDAPWSLQRRLFYSAGQAQFMTFDVLVLDASAIAAARLNPPRPPYDPEPLYEEEFEWKEPEEAPLEEPRDFPCIDGVDVAVDDEGSLSIQSPSLQWPGIEVLGDSKKKEEKPSFRGDLMEEGTFAAGLQWLKQRLDERPMQRPVQLQLGPGASVSNGHLNRLVGEIGRLAPASDEYALLYNTMPDRAPTGPLELKIPLEQTMFQDGFTDWVSVQSFGLGYYYHYPLDSCDEPDGTIRERPDEGNASGPIRSAGPSLLEALGTIGEERAFESVEDLLGVDREK
jgi:hypothetical protein